MNDRIVGQECSAACTLNISSNQRQLRSRPQIRANIAAHTINAVAAVPIFERFDIYSETPSHNTPPMLV